MGVNLANYNEICRSKVGKGGVMPTKYFIFISSECLFTVLNQGTSVDQLELDCHMFLVHR